MMNVDLGTKAMTYGDSANDKAAFEKITADSIIIGFTGALGSGSTFLAEGLAKFHSYQCLRLSKIIRSKAAEKGLEPTPSTLQDLGDQLRRENGNHFLVWSALWEEEERRRREDLPGRAHLVIDGIRNTKEVDFLRQFPNFYLVSVQAESEKRRKRMIESGKCKDEDEFNRADKRDEEEREPYGQKVKKCNYLSDINLINEEYIAKDDEHRYRQYVNEKLYEKYVAFIEDIAEDKPRLIHLPEDDETLMTMAYVESKRSKCLKRKVGAVVTTDDEAVLSAGNNSPPDGISCLDHPGYKWCARDVLLERMGRAIKRCPECGHEIKTEASCVSCQTVIREYTRRCGCGNDPAIEYSCPNCGTDIYQKFLPGGNPDTGKMLDMCRSLHAEENALLALSKAGILASQAKKVYTTTFPCNLCANKIVKMGIKEVVYAEPYVTREAMELLQKDRVNLRRFEGVKSIAYFRLFS